MNNKARSYSLLEANDSVLVAIDVQEAFLDKLPLKESTQLVNNVCWLVRLACWLRMPLIVTAEEHERQPLAPKLVDTLAANTMIFDKVMFGLAHQPDILDAVRKTNRRSAVLVGLETDVCVVHSAIGLLEQDYRVAVVADATGSPGPGHELGLDRMRCAGAIILSTKGLFYEWLRSVEAVKRFHSENPDLRDWSGIVL